jgi:glycosyltransferase involved in cell wall biosynthesis
VLCNYNHAEFIGQAIEAIVSQMRQPDEFIILDDASTDDSVRVIEGYANKYPFISFFKNSENMGALGAITLAHSKAKGDYVYGAAADDYILPGFFEEAMVMAEKYPLAGIVFGQMLTIDTANNLKGVTKVASWESTRYVSPDMFLHEYMDVEPATHSLGTATIYRRKALEEVGGFRRELGHWCDTFAARAIALKHGACYLAFPCAVWRIIPGSLANSSRLSPTMMLRIVSRASALMRSTEFRDLFPEDHVLRWEEGYYEFILQDYKKICIEQNDLITSNFIKTQFVYFELPKNAIMHENGFCYLYQFKTNAGKIFSRFTLYKNSEILENSQTLDIKDSSHDDIRSIGMGRYSMWSDCIYFSSTDNSDPRYNKKRYTVSVPAYIHFLENLPIEHIQKFGL